MKYLVLASVLLGATSVAIAHPAKHQHEGPEYVQVFKHDSSVQCEKSSGIKLSKMKEELANAGIEVKCSFKGSDGMMRIQMCGGPTGKLNVYKIPADKLTSAVDLGFKSVKSLKGFKAKPCH